MKQNEGALFTEKKGHKAFLVQNKGKKSTKTWKVYKAKLQYFTGRWGETMFAFYYLFKIFGKDPKRWAPNEKKTNK